MKLNKKNGQHSDKTGDAFKIFAFVFIILQECTNKNCKKIDTVDASIRLNFHKNALDDSQARKKNIIKMNVSHFKVPFLLSTSNGIK